MEQGADADVRAPAGRFAGSRAARVARWDAPLHELRLDGAAPGWPHACAAAFGRRGRVHLSWRLRSSVVRRRRALAGTLPASRRAGRVAKNPYGEVIPAYNRGALCE